MKYKEPKFVTEWREMKAPKCCHTCDNYLPDGKCRKFNMIPPEDFAMTDGACPNWVLEIGF